MNNQFVIPEEVSVVVAIHPSDDGGKTNETEIYSIDSQIGNEERDARRIHRISDTIAVVDSSNASMIMNNIGFVGSTTHTVDVEADVTEEPDYYARREKYGNNRYHVPRDVAKARRKARKKAQQASRRRK